MENIDLDMEYLGKPNPHLTPDECRNGIRSLMIEHLGIAWSRANIPSGFALYGVPDADPPIPAVPDADLPGLYAKAQRDTLAVLAAARQERVRVRQAGRGGPPTCWAVELVPGAD